MLEQVQGLRPLQVPLNGGIDEVSPADALLPEDCLKFTNWRLSKDGKRIQKRAGLQQEDTAFAQDVYGYTTYHNSSAQFCKIAVLEAKAQRSTNGAAYADLFSFTSNIDHTVRVLEIQDKQFIITEKGSRVVLTNGDVRQIGITAPTTIPTAASSYVGTGTQPLTDTMNYADQAAMDAVWTDADAAGGESTFDETNPDSIAGPNADAKFMRLNSTSGLGIAYRYRTTAAPMGNVFAVELATYFDDLSDYATLGGFAIIIDNGVFKLTLHASSNGVWVTPRNEIDVRVISDPIPTNKWIVWNIVADGTEVRDVVVNVFLTWDGMIKASGTTQQYLLPSTSANRVSLQAICTPIPTGYITDVHVDYVYVRTTLSDTAQITGLYRYAVSFVRDGDYGCESNPIKSQIGTITFSGAGVNDITLNAESEYTGSVSKTIRVQVKTAASPQDTIEWSEDGGLTWNGEIKLATKVYLGYGITVNFATITGHTATNYWEIPCYACSAVATMQQITLSSIPVSTDEQVTARKIYRTTANGSLFYYLTTIYDRATTTVFVDNFPDSILGDEMEEDRDLFTEASSTIGKFAEWWDNRLWIADATENLLYYSAVRDGGPVPEEFAIDERFIPVDHGDQDDVITALRAYKDALYVFKRNDIYIIQKTRMGYAPYHLNSDLGCIADNCVEVVNDFLMFPSERGLEVYDGVRSYSPDFAVAISETFRTADPAGFKYMSIAHDKEFNEVWLNIPSRLSGAAAITVAWNYIRNKFYYFQFYKVPSWIGRCKDSTGKSVLKMGTRDGFVLLCDYGTADHTTAITATYRKGWIDMQAHGIAQLVQTSYEIPASMTLTLNVYVDLQAAAFRTDALTGVTPATATDIDLRRIIGAKTELGVRGRWISIEYVNAQDCGGACKVNECVIYARPETVKNKSYGN